MRILQLFNHYLEEGGEEEAVRRISEALDDHHEFHQLSFASEEWINEPRWMKVTQPLRFFYNPKSVRLLREAVREFRPDVVLVHNVFPVGSLGLYRLLRDLGIPVVQYIHNFRPFSVNGYCWAGGELVDAGLRRNFWPEIVRGSWQQSRLKTACYAAVIQLGHQLGVWGSIEGWVAISEFMRDKFVEGGISAERIRVIPHSWKLVNEAEPPPGAQAGDGKHLLFLGRITEEKGLRVLADAWEQVEKSRSDGRMIVAGEGPLLEWFRERTAGCSRLEAIGFAGGERKAQLIRDARAMVVPSVWWEPLGLVAYEAYDYGKPVLAARSGGLAEIVEDQVTGWVHRPGEVAELVAHIHQVLDQPAEATKRGLAGREWLKRNTGVEQWMEGLEQALTAAIGKTQ